MAIKTDNQTAEERLAPIRLWAHANHGAVKRLSDRLSQMTGRPVMRQTIGRWLHKDSTKRQQPSYGFGILLEQAATEIQEEMRKESDEAIKAQTV